jgi:hypothetical protein
VDRTTLNGFGVLDLTGLSDVAIVGAGLSSVIKQRRRDWTAVVNPTLLWCEHCRTVSFIDLTLEGSRGDAGSVGRAQMHGIDLRSSTGVPAERVRSRTCTATACAFWVRRRHELRMSTYVIARLLRPGEAGSASTAEHG